MLSLSVSSYRCSRSSRRQVLHCKILNFACIRPRKKNFQQIILLSDYNLQGFKFEVSASSSRKSLKKLKREAQQGKLITKNVDKKTVTEEEEVAQVSSPKFKETQDTSISKDSIEVAPRDKVLQACTITSGLMAALGLIIRTVNI